jgi:hypothetical protein
MKESKHFIVDGYLRYLAVMLACPEEAENRGLNAEDVLAGMLWRRVRLKGGEIAAREDD